MNLKRSIGLFVGILFIFTLFGCVSGSGGKKTPEPVDTGKIVYLKNNIHVQKKFSRGGEAVYRASYANYTAPGQGHMIIPLNTPVTIKKSRSIRGAGILITTKDGKKIHFEFNSRNMGMAPEDYFDYITAPNKVSMKGLSKKDRKGITNGKAYVGMSKRGIRMALGYPALHRTPTLEENTWFYWKNRFRTMAVEFNSKGRVRNIRG